MLLPESFTFTQQNLQDFVDCPRRFYLRAIKRLEWPAIESEPIREQEHLIEMGSRFHLLCQQYFSGIPAETLSAQVTDAELALWWNRFLAGDFKSLAGSFAVEKMVSLPFAGVRLAAKFDLVMKLPEGKILIYDWKTSQKQPKRQYLLERMQSKVYPLVAARAETANPVAAEAIEMVYWYPALDGSEVRLQYSQAQLEDDQKTIEMMITDIAARDEEGFEKTDNQKVCTFCRYRSLCDRGLAAGIASAEDFDNDPDDIFKLDFNDL